MRFKTLLEIPCLSRRDQRRRLLLASGSSIAQCGVTTSTAIQSGAVGVIDSFFLRPVTSIGRLAFEWDEVYVSPSAFTASVAGGIGRISVWTGCPWSAVSDSALDHGRAGLRRDRLREWRWTNGTRRSTCAQDPNYEVCAAVNFIRSEDFPINVKDLR